MRPFIKRAATSVYSEKSCTANEHPARCQLFSSVQLKIGFGSYNLLLTTCRLKCHIERGPSCRTELITGCNAGFHTIAG